MKKLIVLICILLSLVFVLSVVAQESGTPYTPITPENVRQITQLAMPVRGGLHETAFSPDWQTLAVASPTGVWLHPTSDLAAAPRLLDEHPAHALAYNPDGSLLAVGREDGVVALWDPSTGELVAELQGHTDTVLCLAFFSEGKKLASGSADTTVRLWDVEARAALPTVLAHENRVANLLFSPDESMILADTVLWDTAGNLLATIGGSFPTFNPDGTRLAAIVHASAESTEIRIWDTAGGLVVDSWQLQTSSECLAYSPDGKYLAVCFPSAGVDVIQIWDTTTGTPVSELTGQGVAWAWEPGMPYDVAFSPDGMLIAAAMGFQGSAQVFDRTTGEVLHILPSGTTFADGVAFSPDGEQIAVFSSAGWGDATLSLWDAASGEFLTGLAGYSPSISDLAFSSDGTRLANISGLDIWFWDPASWQRTVIIHSRRWWNHVAFSPDGGQLAAACISYDSAFIQFWGIPRWGGSDPMEMGWLEGEVENTSPPASFPAPAYSPDGLLLAWRDGNRIRVSVVVSKEDRWVIEFAAEAVVSNPVFHPNGTQLAVGVDSVVKLLDVSNGEVVGELDAGLGDAQNLAYSPDGHLLAAGYSEGELIIWEGDTILQLLSGYTDRVQALNFSPDGRILVDLRGEHVPLVALYTLYNPGDIHLWDVENGELLHTLEGATRSLTFSPDGALLVTGGSDGALRVLGIPSN